MKKLIKLTSAGKKGLLSPGTPVFIEAESVRVIEMGQAGGDPRTGQGAVPCTAVFWSREGGAGVVAVTERPVDIAKMVSEASQ